MATIKSIYGNPLATASNYSLDVCMNPMGGGTHWI